MFTPDRFAGCILGGAIGDAYGSSYEQTTPERPQPSTYYPFGRPIVKHYWAVTDDTQLTLATCEAIAACEGQVRPEAIAARFCTTFKPVS